MKRWLIIVCLCVIGQVEAMDTVRVATVRQFVDSLRSDCIFILEPGTYNVSEHPSIAGLDPKREYKDVEITPVVRYSSGAGLTLYSLSNVRITTDSEIHGVVTIASSDMDDDVLTLLGCSNVRIEHLQFTHDPAAVGAPKGGLLNVSQSGKIQLLGCALTGRAAVGFSAWRCKEISVTGSSVNACSYGIADVRDCWTIRFEKCTFTENKTCQHLWYMSGCTDVQVNNCVFENNRVRESGNCEDARFFMFSRCEMVKVENNSFRSNECTYFGDAEVSRIVSDSNEMKRNRFAKLSSN